MVMVVMVTPLSPHTQTRVISGRSARLGSAQGCVGTDGDGVSGGRRESPTRSKASCEAASGTSTSGPGALTSPRPASAQRSEFTPRKERPCGDPARPVLTCLRVQRCSLPGLDPRSIFRSRLPERLQSGAKCPSHQRKVRSAKPGGRKHPSGAAGAHKGPSRWGGGGAHRARRSGREGESAQRATLARPAGHPPNFGRPSPSGVAPSVLLFRF